MKAEKVTVRITIGGGYQTDYTATIEEDVVGAICSQHGDDAASQIIDTITPQIAALLLCAVVKMTTPEPEPVVEENGAAS